MISLYRHLDHILCFCEYFILKEYFVFFYFSFDPHENMRKVKADNDFEKICKFDVETFEIN